MGMKKCSGRYLDLKCGDGQDDEDEYLEKGDEADEDERQDKDEDTKRWIKKKQAARKHAPFDSGVCEIK